MATRVLIVGISTRAAADSAARAGFAVTAIDGFADLDQHPTVTALSVPRGFRPRAALRMATRIHADAVAYLSNVENDPSVVRALASGRALWGNPPEVLRRVRDPRALELALRKRGLPYPRPNVNNPAVKAVIKPLASGGGHGIHFWQPGTTIARGSHLQEYIDGAPGSVVFIASRHGVSVLGMTRQLIGRESFGVSGFRYCGSLLVSAPRGLLAQARALAEATSVDFGLVGVNGIDFMIRDEVLFPIEVNPRWTASMELVERCRGISVFGAHAEACAAGTLPALDAETALPGVVGKAIVFAKRDVVIRAPESWLTNPMIRDIPHRGDRIKRGQPVCTVFAKAPDEVSCCADLERRAASIYAQLSTWARGAVA